MTAVPAAVVLVIPGSLTGGGNGTATTAGAGGRLVAPVDPAQGAVCRGEKQGETRCAERPRSGCSRGCVSGDSTRHRYR